MLNPLVFWGYMLGIVCLIFLDTLDHMERKGKEINFY